MPMRERARLFASAKFDEELTAEEHNRLLRRERGLTVEWAALPEDHRRIVDVLYHCADSDSGVTYDRLQDEARLGRRKRVSDVLQNLREWGWSRSLPGKAGEVITAGALAAMRELSERT
jgi:hypothetical protein